MSPERIALERKNMKGRLLGCIIASLLGLVFGWNLLLGVTIVLVYIFAALFYPRAWCVIGLHVHDYVWKDPVDGGIYTICKRPGCDYRDPF